MRPTKIQLRLSRKNRIRSKIRGTVSRPRLSVYRSLKRMTAQLIDDIAGRTIVSASTSELKAPLSIEGAKKLGGLLAKKAKEAKVDTIVFDRNGYKYHGRVKALADAAREGGLQF